MLVIKYFYGSAVSTLPNKKSEPNNSSDLIISTWQDLRYANGTLEEWVKKSDEEFAAIEEEIREIRELLDE